MGSQILFGFESMCINFYFACHINILFNYLKTHLFHNMIGGLITINNFRCCRRSLKSSNVTSVLAPNVTLLSTAWPGDWLRKVTLTQSSSRKSKTP